MNSIGIYFVLYSFIVSAVVFYLQSFISILNFKWYIDLYYVKDKTCLKKQWAKYEIETYRYNLYRFLLDPVNNKESYENIYKIYKNNHFLFISFYAVFLIICLIVIIYFNMSQTTNDILYIFLSYLVLVIMYIIYTIVNSVLLSKFDSMNSMLIQDNNAINIYHNVYKILNAIMYINNPSKILVEYSNPKLNETKKTFDELIENNIASYENISNTSKILQIKNICYDNLDFMKFCTFDKLSSYFMKFFNTTFIILPEYAQELQYDISQNLYLSEIFLKRNNSVNYENVKLEFDNIVTALKEEKRESYVNIKQYITSSYPTKDEYQPIIDCYQQVFYLFSNDTGLEEYDNILQKTIQKYLQNIDDLLKSHQDNKIYIEINYLIHKTLVEKKQDINLGNIPKNRLNILDEKKTSEPVQDYIRYYLENKDILFDTESERDSRFYDWNILVNSYSDYIYAYFIYFIFIFCVFSHYLYTTINDIQYVFIILGLIGLYFSYGYLTYTFRYVY